MRALALLALLAVAAPAALAAPLPGVKTPSRNISCFFVPIKPDTCMARESLDWHDCLFLSSESYRLW